MFLCCCGCNVSWCSVCSECFTFCLSCDACSARCWLMGNRLVSSCRCCVLVSRVHPVVIRSAVFCAICSLFVFVSDIIGDQIVLPYSSFVLVMAVYVLSSAPWISPVCIGESFWYFLVFFRFVCSSVLYVF